MILFNLLLLVIEPEDRAVMDGGGDYHQSFLWFAPIGGDMTKHSLESGAHHEAGHADHPFLLARVQPAKSHFFLTESILLPFYN